MLTLYDAPNSSAMGIRLLLSHLGLPYERVTLNLAQGEQNQPAYLLINPKGKVPYLTKDDGRSYSEFQSIAMALAEAHPQAGLLAPVGSDTRYQILALLDYLVGTVHMRGYTLMRMPQKFTSIPAAQDEVRAHGRSVFVAGLAHLEGEIAAKGATSGWLFGQFSLADAAIYYILVYAELSETLADYPSLVAYLAQLRASPASLAMA